MPVKCALPPAGMTERERFIWNQGFNAGGGEGLAAVIENFPDHVVLISRDGQQLYHVDMTRPIRLPGTEDVHFRALPIGNLSSVIVLIDTDRLIEASHAHRMFGELEDAKKRAPEIIAEWSADYQEDTHADE